MGEMTSWDSFVEAARGYGVADASLWVTLVREVEPKEVPLEDCWALVSTRRFSRRLRGLPGVPSAMAYRERRLPGAEGGLRAGEAAVGARRRGGPLPHDPDDPGVQHGADLPESRRPTIGEAGDSPPASRGAAGAGTKPRGGVHGRLLRRAVGRGTAPRGGLSGAARVATRHREAESTTRTHLTALSPMV